MRLRAYIFALLAVASSAHAQSDIDQAIQSEHIAGAYASMINFAAEPDIAAAKLNIDSDSTEDNVLNVFKMPLRHEFALQDKSWKPIVQATLARLKMTSSIPVFNIESIDATWTAYSATLGGGARIPLSKHWAIVPVLDGGYAYIKNEADYGAVSGPILDPILSGKLFDWEAHAWLVSAHLSLLYNQMFGNLEIDAHLSGTASYIESFNTTSYLQEFSETIGTTSLKLDATHPLGFSLWRHPMFGVGHLGHSTLISDSEIELGFRHLNEAGFSFKADISRHQLPVKSLSLGAMVLWGDNVSGWKILVGYRF